MTDDSNQLILGLIYGLSLEQIKPFFLSLEKSGYRGDMAMFVHDLGAAAQAFLRARRVQLLPYQRPFLRRFSSAAARFPALFLTARKRDPLSRHLALAYLHPRCARFLLYDSFLQECGGNYRRVMLTDIRDVLFQANPFAFEMPEGLCVFFDEPGRTLGGCDKHSLALVRAFGRSALREMSGRPIACVGTTLGTAAAVREYLAAFVRILLEKKNRKSVDYAVHNFLVHQQPLARLHRFENFSGPVATLGCVDPSWLPFNDHGQIVNRDGLVINVLHQFDRHPELAQRLMATLA